MNWFRRFRRHKLRYVGGPLDGQVDFVKDKPKEMATHFADDSGTLSYTIRHGVAFFNKGGHSLKG